MGLRRGVGRTIVGATLALLVGALTVPSAYAHNDYPWTNCSFEFTDAGFDVYVKNDPSSSFPVNGTGDGVINSFTDRISYGISQWNGQMAYGGMVAYTGTSDDVRLRYGTAPSDTAFGQTTWFKNGRTQIQGCPSGLHVADPQIPVTWAVVDIRSRGDWFTQNNSRRAYWEACPGGTTYTCSKWFDFGSTLTHELGHTVGLLHPTDVDAHNGNSTGNGTQAINAHCNSVSIYDGSDDSTMCGSDGDASNSENRYQSCRRTLSSYDMAALADHEANN